MPNSSRYLSKRILGSAILLLSLLFPATLFANGGCVNAYSWDGTVGDWSDQSRWLLGGLSNQGVPGPGNCAIINSGSVALDLDVSVETLQLGGGTLSGLFDVAAARFEWTGGLLAGADFTTVQLTTSTGCFFSGAASKQVVGRSVVCGGISEVVDTGEIIIGGFTSEGEIRIPEGATMRLAGDQTFTGQGGSTTGSFVNLGTFERPIPVASRRERSLAGLPGTTVFTSADFDNAGTVRVEEGALEFAGGTSTGVFQAEVADLLVITFTSGTHQLLAGFSFSGVGFAGQSGGVVDIDGAGSAERWQQNGGRLQGDAEFTVAHLEWSGGTLQGPGDKIATTTFTILGNGSKIAAGMFTIENRGAGTWQGSGTIFLDQTTLRNTSSASFEIQTDAVLSRGASQGFFVNQGLVQKTSSGGITSLQLDVSNAGMVEILNGALELKGGTGRYLQTAGATWVSKGQTLIASSLDLEGGFVEIDGELIANAAGTGVVTIEGGMLLGSGTVVMNTLSTVDSGTIAGNLQLIGNLTGGGFLAPGNSPGTLDFDGDVSLTAASSFVVELAGLAAGTNYDQLTATGLVSLGGTLNVQLTQGFRPQVGDSFLLADANTTGAFDLLELPAGAAWQVSNDPVVLSVVVSSPIFVDGFEDGTTEAWTATVTR